MDHGAVLPLLFASLLAALAAGGGVLPFLGRRGPSARAVGFAYALAAGAMLGGGHLLLAGGIREAAVPVIAGAVCGMAYSFWTHRYARLAEALPAETRPTESQTARILLQHALHAATEGVAVGAAALVELRFGLFVALALAAHNVAEAVTLIALLRRAGTQLLDAAGIAVITKIPQPLLAVFTYVVVLELPRAHDFTLGLAAGSLLYLVISELLPAGYDRAGREVSALLITATAGAVVLFEGLLL